MNDNIKESLSALVDGETDELELRRILKAMEGEEATAEEDATAETADSLRQRWSRYHLISAVIKNESVAVSDSGFLARVNAEIDGHEYQQSDNATFAGAASLNQTVSSVAAPSLAARAAPSQWSRFAVAASVALAVVIGVNQWRAADQNGVVPAPLTVADRPVVNAGAASLVAASSEVNTLRSSTVSASSSQSVVLDEAQPYSAQELALAQRRLNAYLLRHAAQTSQQGGQGTLPYARLTTYETE